MSEAIETVTVYGASDDLIEVEGALSEEFYFHGKGVGEIEGDTWVFSDGTVLSIDYDSKGVWRIGIVHHGSASVTMKVCPGDDGEGDYSDRCTLDGDLRWVVHADEKFSP